MNHTAIVIGEDLTAALLPYGPLSQDTLAVFSSCLSRLLNPYLTTSSDCFWSVNTALSPREPRALLASLPKKERLRFTDYCFNSVQKMSAIPAPMSFDSVIQRALKHKAPEQQKAMIDAALKELYHDSARKLRGSDDLGIQFVMDPEGIVCDIVELVNPAQKWSSWTQDAAAAKCLRTSVPYPSDSPGDLFHPTTFKAGHLDFDFLIREASYFAESIFDDYQSLMGRFAHLFQPLQQLQDQGLSGDDLVVAYRQQPYMEMHVRLCRDTLPQLLSKDPGHYFLLNTMKDAPLAKRRMHFIRNITYTHISRLIDTLLDKDWTTAATASVANRPEGKPQSSPSPSWTRLINSTIRSLKPNTTIHVVSYIS